MAMTDREQRDESEWSPPRGILNRAKAWVGVVGLLGVLKSAAKKSEFADEPQILFRNEKADEIAGLAEQLAASDRSDDECVRQLVTAVGKDRNMLSRAAAVVRFGGRARESRVADRANRLLLAAFSGEQVVLAPPEFDELMNRIDQFGSVEFDEAYAELVQLRPELRTVEEQFSSRFTDQPFDPELLDDDQWHEQWSELEEALKPVVGPEADEDVGDPLLRSRFAFDLASMFLGGRMGLVNNTDDE
jgi:hypothetical protein